MQTHQKLPEKVKAEVARNTLKQGEISSRMIAVEGRRDKLFETLTRLAEHLEMGYAKAPDDAKRWRRWRWGGYKSWRYYGRTCRVAWVGGGGGGGG